MTDAGIPAAGGQRFSAPGTAAALVECCSAAAAGGWDSLAAGTVATPAVCSLGDVVEGWGF